MSTSNNLFKVIVAGGTGRGLAPTPSYITHDRFVRVYFGAGFKTTNLRFIYVITHGYLNAM
jgi:hypothetical protein